MSYIYTIEANMSYDTESITNPYYFDLYGNRFGGDPAAPATPAPPKAKPLSRKVKAFFIILTICLCIVLGFHLSFYNNGQLLKRIEVMKKRGMALNTYASNDEKRKELDKELTDEENKFMKQMPDQHNYALIWQVGACIALLLSSVGAIFTNTSLTPNNIKPNEQS